MIIKTPQGRLLTCPALHISIATAVITIAFLASSSCAVPGESPAAPRPPLPTTSGDTPIATPPPLPTLIAIGTQVPAVTPFPPTLPTISHVVLKDLGNLAGLPIRGLVTYREESDEYVILQDTLAEEEVPLPDRSWIPTHSPLLVSPDLTRLAFVRLGQKAQALTLETIAANGSTEVVYTLPPESFFWCPIAWFGADVISLANPLEQDSVLLVSTEEGSSGPIAHGIPTKNTEGTIISTFCDFPNAALLYNPDRSRALILRLGSDKLETHEMWDPASAIRLWGRESCPTRGSFAQWSPDRTSFAIALTPNLDCDPYSPYREGILYLVDQAGNEEMIARSILGPVTWSPDGSQIAAKPTEGGPFSVAVVDVATRQVTLFEFGGDSSFFGFDLLEVLVWSPTGRYLALNEWTDEELEHHRIVVLDTVESVAYRVLDNAYAHAWLAP